MSIVYSSNVRDECFKLKVGCLDGKRPSPNLSELIKNPHLVYTGLDDQTCADLLIECGLESDSSPLCPPMQTTYKYFTNQWSWNEWIEFPIAICDLPRDTKVIIKILDSVSPSKTVILGKAFVSVFGHQGIIRTGLYDLRVWFENELEQAREMGDNILTASLSGQDELDRLYELKSNYHNGQTIKIDWLDKLTFLEMEKMTQRMKADSKNMFISVEFPKALIENTIDVPILYNEITLEDHRAANALQKSSKNDLVMINDPELGLENIIEGKHHRLSRGARSCISDKDLKPNALVRDQLNAIVGYPPTKVLTSEEQDLVWKFRYYLMSQKRALTKFLKCLNWQAQAEVKIALELLYSWQPMDTSDALELLTPHFQHPQVRLYAVGRLRQATDEDLLLYLLQLVQALKYENYQGSNSSSSEVPATCQTESLQHQNLQLHQQLSGLVLSPKDLQGGSSKKQQSSSPEPPLPAPGDNNLSLDRGDEKPLMSSNEQKQPTIRFNDQKQKQQQPIAAASTAPQDMTQWDLSTFLINRCVQDDVLANYFYWYLVVEIENFSQNIGEINSTNATSIASNQKNMQAHKIYTDVMDRFIRTLSADDEAFKRRRDFLSRQRLFVDKLVSLMKMVSKENKNRLGKIEKLKESLADPEILKFDFTHLDPPLSLPLDPSVKIQGILPERATLFKSQLMPCRLTLRTTIYEKSILEHSGKARIGILSTSPLTATESITMQNDASFPSRESPSSDSPFLEYNVIFKHGDDLRQDQLILQTITLMDKLLRRENLDLKLTPYRVLATSTRHGFVQYIDSISLAEVRTSEGSIQNFFRRYAPSSDSPYGIAPDVMDTYVRSCAGYCVITYLLGVGDRHLDNLLLTKTGKLFHIDFGYILGRDPKPMPPPPMKLTREMVEAMGGTSSERYNQFLDLSYTAFIQLRRHSNLILNLFALMVDANVPDIALEPDKTVKKVQDKFMLDLSDEEAVHYMRSLIEISVSDVMAQLVEQIHKIAQYWRK